MLRHRTLVLILAFAPAVCFLAWQGTRGQSTLRRITNTTDEGISINPSISGDGRIIGFESTEDVAGAGGPSHFRAIRGNISVDPATFFQVGATRAVAPALSQDGSRIAFASKDDPLGTNADGNSEIFLFNGSSLLQVTNTSPGDPANRVVNGNFQPSISDDGRFIAFASNRNLTSQNSDGNLEIFVYDSAAATFAQLTNSTGSVGCSDAKISGNGAKVAYIRDSGASPSAKRDLMIQDRTSASATVLASQVQSLLMTYGRAISDDGTRVTYSGETATNSSQVFFFDGRSGNLNRQVTSLGTRVTEIPLHPTISGDGKRIAFATRRAVTGFSNSDSSVELYTYDIPSTTFSRVTNVTANEADCFDGGNQACEVVSSLSDDGAVVVFNFPRVLSGTVASGLENKSEIYATGTVPPPAGTLTILNQASLGHEPSPIKAVAPNSIAAAFGSALANTTEQAQKQANGSFPTNVAGTTVTVNGRAAQIFFVSPERVHFLVPAQTEIGTAEVVVTNADGFSSRGNVPILRAAPGIFTKTGDGIGEGMIIDADTLAEGPFDPSGGNLRLLIFTTGVRNALQTTVNIGGRIVNAESVVPSPTMPGLDEVRVRVPTDLRGTNVVNLTITADGRDSNPVSVKFTGDPSRNIVINEVLADPPDGTAGDANHDGVRDSTQDEFVELVNGTSNELINLSGWTLRTRATGSTTETTRFTFASGTSLPAGSAIVVFGGGNFNPSDPVFGCAQVVKPTTASGLSLTNSGLTILVRDASGNEITEFSYGGSTGFAGDNDQSLTRSPDITGNFAQHSVAEGAFGRKFSPGLRIDGTPFGTCAGHVTTVTIAPPSKSVGIGQTTQFTSQAFDEYGRVMTNVTITFASDNPNVATVDSVSMNTTTGVATANVTGHNQGVAHIQASATDGTTTMSSPEATLNVVPQISRVEVSPASATINRGNTQQFTATAFDQNNQPLSGLTFAWQSSNTNVATIDGNGLALGVGIGTVTITASISDGLGGTVSNTASLTVQVPLVINEINADVAPDNVSTLAIEGDANRDGVRDSGADEFVELLNNSNSSVDLSGVVIADSTSNRFTFPANTILASGRAVVVFGGGSPPANDPAFGGALIFTASSLSLNDTGDTVNVKLSVGGSDVVIASQAYGGSSGVVAPNDQSLTRSPDAAIGNSGGSFVAHTAATNAAGRIFSPGTRVDGTPFGSPPITRISVDPPTARVNSGATQSFNGHAFSNTGGPEIEIQNVSFIWDSSDTSKAVVAPLTGPNTTAHAVGSGDATINARAGGQTGSATLSVNPTLSINDVALNEGNSGTTTFTFTVNLSNPAPTGGVSFDIATADGTATTADNDYVARSLTGQTIAAGAQTYMFDVTVNGDTTIEENETFFVNVTNISGATAVDPQGQGTILTDDSAVLSVVSPPPTAEGDSGTRTFTFTVHSSLPAPSGGITFDITTQDNTATAGSDYVARSLTNQTIPQGQQDYVFDVTVNGDTLVEPNETFFVKVTSASNGSPQGTGTINNDDAADLVISQVYGGGGNTSSPAALYKNDFIEVFNRGSSTVDLAGWSVQYSSASGTGSWSVTALCPVGPCLLLPGKYFLVQEDQGTGGTQNLPTPDATGTIAMATTSGKVALVSDATALSGACPSGASILDQVGYGGSVSTTNFCFEGSGPAPAPGNITADFRKAGGCVDSGNNAADFFVAAPFPRNSASPVNNCAGPTPNLSIDDVTVSEGNIGTTTATFTVSLSAPAQGADVTFDIATADGTATTANSDYVAKTLPSQIIPAGQTSYTFTVTVNGDMNVEPDETFIVNVTNVVGANVTDGQGTGTISNDDVPTLSIGDATIVEGDTGTTTANFTVTLSDPAPAGGVSFTVNTADGTTNPATAGSDYVAIVNGSGSISVGNTSTTVSVTINGDTTLEPNETFFVNLSSPSNATITDGQGLGTIQDDDSPPNLSVTNVTLAEGNSGQTTFAFTVQLSAPAKVGGVTFDIATQDGTATTVGNDYLLNSLTAQTIPQGSSTYTFNVLVNGDVVFEASETFFVNVTNVSGATVVDPQGLGTITNDDTAPTIAIADASITEGNSGTSLMTFTVTMTGTSQSNATVDYATADSSATIANTDYDATNNTLTFAPGDVSKTFTVTIHGDTNAEGDEMFLVNLSNANGATISDNQALGTIFLDDPFSIAAVNTAYAENFDSLAQAGNSSTTPTAWTRAETGSSANTTYTANNGASTTGDTYSYGTTGQTDRALGGLRTGTLVPTVGAFYRNNTGATVNALEISYTGEEWRLGTASRTDQLDFQYSTDATSLATGTWTDVNALDFTTPNATTTGSKDGNAVGNRTAISSTITGLSIAPGATFWIRWSDFDASGSDDGLAVDDFTLTALNQPALSIDDVTQNEGNSGDTIFTFNVNLSQAAPAGGVAFTVNTADGTATVANNDYLAIVNGNGSISAGNTSTTVSVTVKGDITSEPNETFFVNLSSPTNAVLGDAQAQGTITNDDAAPPVTKLVISQVYGGGSNSGAAYASDFVQLFNSGTTTIDFSVTPYSVQYASATGTFSSGNKVDLTSGTLVPGQYFLIKLAPVTPTTGTSFTADITNTGINMSATDGKVALVLGTTVATTTAGCPTAVTVADLLGYGGANCAEGTATAVLSATKVAVRNANGCTDAGNNSTDFTVTTVNTSSAVPKNSSAAPSPCP